MKLIEKIDDFLQENFLGRSEEFEDSVFNISIFEYHKNIKNKYETGNNSYEIIKQTFADQMGWGINNE